MPFTAADASMVLQELTTLLIKEILDHLIVFGFAMQGRGDQIFLNVNTYISIRKLRVLGRKLRPVTL